MHSVRIQLNARNRAYHFEAEFISIDFKTIAQSKLFTNYLSTYSITINLETIENSKFLANYI